MDKNKFFLLSFWAAIGLVSLLLLKIVGPVVESAFNPVYGSAQVTRLVSIEEERKTKIWGRFKVLRNCELISLEWYYSPDGTSAVLVPSETPKLRGAEYMGWVKFGPWTVALESDAIRFESFAIARHRCHGFWDLETRIWPTKD